MIHGTPGRNAYMVTGRDRRQHGKKRMVPGPVQQQKTWEVVKMVGGYYLRQYVDGQQVNTGLRTTKAFIASIGIFEFERIA